MKKIKLLKIFTLFFITSTSLISCLKKGDMNIDLDSKTGTVMTLQYIEGGSGSTINSGLNYFSGGALTFPATDISDTAHYNINLAGDKVLGSDLTVTVGVDESKKLDYFATDSIEYEIMPDSLYKFVSTSATIKAGERIAAMQIVFYPSKIDPTKSYILPVTIKDAGGNTVSSNYGTIYFHVIGNPIAGMYNWDFYRYNNQDGSGAPAGGTFFGDVIVFSPVNPNTIKVPTGYYVQPNYVITFDNNNGVLSNFKAQIAPDEIKAAFTDNGISVVAGPTITVAPDLSKFTINYVVYNGSAYRNCTDIYYK